MSRPRLPVVLWIGLLAVSGCRSRSGDDPGAQPTGDTIVTGLRLETAAAAWPGFVLRWNAEVRAAPPSAFRIFSAPEPLTESNRTGYQVAEVAGSARSAQVEIPRRSGLRFLAVQAIDADRTPGHLSKTLPLDTTDRVAFRALDGADTELWMTDDTGKAVRVAGGAEMHGWAPGSRGLAIVATAGGRAALITPAIWNGALGSDNAAPPSLPDGAVTPGWFSLRIATNGSVAYRAGPDGRAVLFVRSTTGRVTRVGPPSGDVRQFAWSPSGSHLLLLVKTGTGLNVDAYVVAADGTGLRRLNPDLSADEYVLFAHWSPSGDAVAFHVVDAGTSKVGTLRMYRLADQSTLPGSTVAHESVWRGPDLVTTTRHSIPEAGMGIALYGPSRGSNGPPPGGPLTVLKQYSGSVFGLRLSPDHRWLAFLHEDPARKKTVRLLDFTTNDVAELPVPAGTIPSRLDWSTSGRYLAVAVDGLPRSSIQVFDSGTGFAGGETWVSGRWFQYFEWSPFEDELMAQGGDLNTRLVRADGKRVLNVAADVPAHLPVTDFAWSNWGMPRTLAVFSTLVSK